MTRCEIGECRAIILTTGIDTFVSPSSYALFQGSTSAATAALNTFQAFDTITASGQGNILNLTAVDYANNDNLAAAQVSGVQTVNIRAIDATATDNLNVNASNFVGSTAINADRSSSAMTVSNLATGASVGMIGNDSVTNGAVTFGYKTASAAATLNVSGGTLGGNVAISSTPTSVTINSNGVPANIIGTLNVGGSATGLTVNAATGLTAGAITGAALKTITVTGAAATAATPVSPAANDITSAVQFGTLPAAVTTINASGMTAGGVGVTLVPTVTSFLGGAGTDTVTTAALTSTTASIIDAGAGVDVLRVGAVTNIDTSTEAQQYAGFEVLDAMATSTAIDMSLFTKSSIVSTRVGGNAVFTNMTAAQAGDVTVYATSSANYGVKGATTVGQIDTINLNVTDGLTAKNTITLGDITAAGVEIININAVDNVTVSALAQLATLTNMTVTGGGNVSLTTGANAAVLNATVNASALTGTLTVNASDATGNGLLVTGSATAVNTLTGSAQADKLVGGAANDVLKGLTGNDVIQGGGGNEAISGNRGADTMTGGTGTDTFTIRPGDSYTYATAGTAMKSTVTIDGIDQTAGAGTATVTTTVNGITVSGTATIGATASDTEIAIATALKTAIDANAELASYVSTAVTGTTTGILTITALGSAPVSVGTTTVGAFTTPLTTAPTATPAVAATSSTASSGVLSVDTITDLDLGGSGAGTGVDTINVSGVTTTALTVVASSAMTGADLSAAVNALFAVGGALNSTTNTVGLFTYGSDTYLIGNVGASGTAFGSATAITNAPTLETASDFIIKVTGVAGTLDASDFTFV